MYIQANGIKFHVATDGPEGKPCVTFVTGIANDHTLWNASVAPLARDYRLIRIDTRGHGLTDATPAPYSLKQLADDVVAVWDAMRVDRSTIVGLGLGGIVVSEVALAHPQRIRGLVPVSCRAKMTPQYDGIWPPLVDAATKAGSVEAVADMTIARWFSEEFRAANPAVMKEVRDAILRTRLQGYLGCIAAIRTLGHFDRLKDLRMPVLYVSGERDMVGAPGAVMQEMCEATPNAKHVVLPGATHISVVSNAPAFTAAMQEFLAQV